MAAHAPDAYTGAIIVAGLGMLVAELAMLRAQLLTNLVRRYVVQSLLFAGIALTAGIVRGPEDLLLEAGMSLVVKVVIVPLVVLRLIDARDSDLAHSIGLRAPAMAYLGLVATGIGFLVVGTLALGVAPSLPAAVVGIAFAQVLVAFLIPILRADVFSQAFGFFAFENAISLASIALAPRLPAVVDAVVFFDLLVAAVVFGLLMRLHHRHHETTSTTTLKELRG
jgi:hydrogenase-4 component E